MIKKLVAFVFLAFCAICFTPGTLYASSSVDSQEILSSVKSETSDNITENFGSKNFEKKTIETPSCLVTWFLSTAAILLLIVVLGMFLKKSRFVRRSNGTMTLEGQISLGPKERVVILKVGQRRLLLGVTQSNINYLSEISQDNESFQTILKKESLVRDKVKDASHD